MLAILAILLASASLLPAADEAAVEPSGRNVLLIVNQRSEVSRRIGEYYAGRREVPAENVCLIAAREEERVARGDYDRGIEKPVQDCLRRHPAPSRILYMATTKGVPLAIHGDEGRNGDAASVDSELTLLRRRMNGEEIQLEGRVANPFFGRYLFPFDPEKYPIFLTTRLTGYDFDDVRAMIDRSLEARNRGFFVLDVSPWKSPDGNSWMEAAARALPRSRVIIDRAPEALYDARGVIGYVSWGSNDPARSKDARRFTGFEWLPGAIATAYVSYDGRTFRRPPADWRPGPWEDRGRYFAGAPQTLTADLIHEGATGASGHTSEPWLDAVPRPNYLFSAYYEGRTLAESFYLAIPYLSWRNVVVGDPLCRLGRQ